MATRAHFGRGMRAGLALILLLFLSSCDDLTGTGGSGELSLLSSQPEPGATNVSVLGDLAIRFSTELNPSSALEAIKLLDGDREILTGVYLKNGKVILLRPTDPLDFGTTYQIRVGATLQSKSGKALSDEASWTFSTEGASPPMLVTDSLRSTLGALAHDSMRGRGSGTPDELRAAEFLEERFDLYGLEPPAGGSLQGFQAYSNRLERLISSQNVLATVPGSGSLEREWIVVGAHYDHVGESLYDDGTLVPHNGADDNASGTALILEMARVYQAYAAEGGMPVEDRRSVLFAAWGAEELGLMGSCHYALLEPVMPLQRTVANLNFDMVGRLRDRVLYVQGFETSSSLPVMVRNANHPELILFDVVSSIPNTDFACFQQEGIPFLSFHTGKHHQYHTPDDDVELINFPGLADVGQLALRTLIHLAVREGPLK